MPKLNWVTALVIPLCVINLSPASAAIDWVPHSVSEFKTPPVAVQSVRVATARVVMADYDLIARDFANLRRMPDESYSTWKSRVDDWIVHETAFISDAQAKQVVVNTPINATDEVKTTYRPEGYGRADVIPVQGGLMDAKGTGSISPSQIDHGNGLATLGEMIREFIFEKAVQMIFNHAGNGARTVGCYAVVDYGFYVRHADQSQSRAGYVLRQAHQRAAGIDSNISNLNAIKIEEVLRKYGVTSGGLVFAHRANGKTVNGKPIDYDQVNIQGTSNTMTTEIVDFGAFLAGVPRFELPVHSYDRWPHEMLSKAEALKNNPDPAIRLPLEQWGVFDKLDPKTDRLWRWSHELAESFATGHADRAAVERHIENFLGPVTARFKDVRRSCRALFSSHD